MDDLFGYPKSPGFQDTDTSKEAAAAIKPRAGQLQEKCFAEIDMADKFGLTADEVATKLGESVLAIRPRVTELNKLGQIEDTGRRRKNESGRGAIVWVAS